MDISIGPREAPGTSVRIAQLLAVRMPQVVIEVFGQPTLNAFDTARLSGFPNVRYHGYFEKLDDIGVSDHYCFLYTSRFDGLPVVLLEMIAAGLPIIAPDVGGIGELIKDQETGLLLACTGDDSRDAEIYVSSVESLFADGRLRERLRQSALSLVAERHAPGHHKERIAQIFGTEIVARPKDLENAQSALAAV